jgi:1-acyl-sn-glycerol-3-phosphate acyltransferase
MNTSRALARLGDLAAKDALPTALRLWQKARDRVNTWSNVLLDRELEQRLEALVRDLGPVGIDPFGWDPDYAKVAMFAAAFLSRSYFRTVVAGVENLPRRRALLVANHAGQIPIDAVMIAISVFLEASPPRMVRAMVEKWAQTLPFVSTFFARCGQVVGVPENARRLLERDELVLVFPEGTRGLSKTYGERYQLTEFGLGFMRLALETGAPIVPVSVVGAEEQYLSFANLEVAAKLLRMPYFPLIPQLLVPGGQLPLPVRYRITFGEPLRFEGDPDDDDAVIRDKVWLVRSTIQSMVNRSLDERQSVFF